MQHNKKSPFLYLSIDRKHIVYSIIGLLLLCPLAACKWEADNIQAVHSEVSTEFLTGSTLVFEEDFNQVGDWQLQTTTDGPNAEAEARIANGKLLISADQDDDECGSASATLPLGSSFDNYQDYAWIIGINSAISSDSGNVSFVFTSGSARHHFRIAAVQLAAENDGMIFTGTYEFAYVLKGGIASVYLNGTQYTPDFTYYFLDTTTGTASIGFRANGCGPDSFHYGTGDFEYIEGYRFD